MDDHDWLIEKTRHLVSALAGIAEYVNTIPAYREVDSHGRPTRESILAGDLHDALDKATKLLAYASDADWGARDRDSVMKQGRRAYQHLCRRYGVYGIEDQFPLPFVTIDNTASEIIEPLGSLSDLESHWTFDSFDLQRPLYGAVIWRNEIIEEKDQRVSLRNALEHSLHYAQHPQGWLLISGAHAVGKSHLAGAIIHKMSEAGLISRYVGEPDLWARYSITDEILWQAERALLESADLVVFDNVDARYHLHGDKYLEQVLRNRKQDGRPTILVSTEGKEELPQWISQVVEELTLIVSDYQLSQKR